MAKRHEMFCWARYLSWCEFLKKHHDALFEKGQERQAQPGDPHDERTLAAMSYWFASLNVVIEGWEMLGLHDPVIDALLTHEDNFRSRLLRFRNATFHFSPDLFDARVVELLGLGEECVLWTEALHSEFVRYLDSLVNAVSCGDEEDAAFRQSLRNLLGWLPEDDNLVVEVRSAIARMEAALERPSYQTAEAKAAFRAAVEETRVLLREAIAEQEKARQSLLAKVLGSSEREDA